MYVVNHCSDAYRSYLGLALWQLRGFWHELYHGFETNQNLLASFDTLYSGQCICKESTHSNRLVPLSPTMSRKSTTVTHYWWHNLPLCRGISTHKITTSLLSSACGEHHTATNGNSNGNISTQYISNGVKYLPPSSLSLSLSFSSSPFQSPPPQLYPLSYFPVGSYWEDALMSQLLWHLHVHLSTTSMVKQVHDNLQYDH